MTDILPTLVAIIATLIAVAMALTLDSTRDTIHRLFQRATFQKRRAEADTTLVKT